MPRRAAGGATPARGLAGARLWTDRPNRGRAIGMCEVRREREREWCVSRKELPSFVMKRMEVERAARYVLPHHFPRLSLGRTRTFPCF